MRFSPTIAPIKVAVFPLLKNKPELVNKAREVFEQLQAIWPCFWDQVGAIGRRYRRQDEIGTPYAVTIDFDTLEDNTVTLRDRDSMEQTRVPLNELMPWLEERRREGAFVDTKIFAGLLLAFVCLGLSVMTGEPTFDALGSIAIGIVLVTVSIFIAWRIRSLLVGRSAEPDLVALIDEIIANNQSQVEEFRAGKEKVLGFFVGQVMKASKGKANPGQVNQLLRAKLKG